MTETDLSKKQMSNEEEGILMEGRTAASIKATASLADK